MIHSQVGMSKMLILLILSVATVVAEPYKFVLAAVLDDQHSNATIKLGKPSQESTVRPGQAVGATD